MIDIKLIRENRELVKENIKRKFQDEKLPIVDEIYELDNLKKEFNFTNLTDTYNVLYTLSTEPDDDIVATTVMQNAGIFGADSQMFASMQSFDKANLKKAFGESLIYNDSKIVKIKF